MKGILILVIITLLLAAGLAVTIDNNLSLKEQVKREKSNFINMSQQNKELSLTVEDYENLHTKDKQKLDSVMALLKIKPKVIKQAVVVNTTYIDTLKILVPTEPSYKKDSLYVTPVDYTSFCFSVKGEIHAKDPKPTFYITEKNYANSAQLIATKQKRFLGFLWVTHKAKYYAKSDCGTITFTDITFVKK